MHTEGSSFSRDLRYSAFCVYYTSLVSFNTILYHNIRMYHKKNQAVIDYTTYRLTSKWLCYKYGLFKPPILIYISISECHIRHESLSLYTYVAICPLITLGAQYYNTTLNHCIDMYCRPLLYTQSHAYTSMYT